MLRTALRRAALALALLPAPLANADSNPGLRSGTVKVMTRNLYVGADVFRVLDARSPGEIPIKVTEIFAIVLQSNPPERMEAIADEIKKTKPHLIGLQEVSTIRLQFPGDFLIGNPTPAEDVLFDYLDLLLAALEERGMDYRPASAIKNVDVELPGFAGFGPGGTPLFFDARLTDRDVILARGDVETANELSGNYTFNASVPVGPVEITFLRGFTSVDAWVHGRKYRFVNTHLEVDLPGDALAFQALQAGELLGILSSVEDPAIVAGDFNSDPRDPGAGGFVPPCQQFAAAGFTDAWNARTGRPKPDATCCHHEFLNNPEPTLDRRIDQVWVRNPGRSLGPIQAKLVGEETEDRTISGLWPSDHAGLVTRMRLEVTH